MESKMESKIESSKDVKSTKRAPSPKSEEDNNEEFMDISKDPRLVEYACTMTGLPEFHIMRTVLINIFGENDKISFENIEDMRRVIEENYTNEEFGIISSGVENINLNETGEQYHEEEEKKVEACATLTMEEITKNLKEFKIYKDGQWIKPPNKNKKCHCNSKLKYKFCCMSSDKKQLDSMIERASNSSSTSKLNSKIQDAEATSFLASLVCI